MLSSTQTGVSNVFTVGIRDMSMTVSGRDSKAIQIEGLVVAYKHGNLTPWMLFIIIIDH
jgi:hypothetical protein